jgi:DNA-binding HxlR family transcriptional regulator
MSAHVRDDSASVDPMMDEIRRILSGNSHLSDDADEHFRKLAMLLTEFDGNRSIPLMGVVGHVGNYWRNWLLVISRAGPLRPSAIRRLLQALDPTHPLSQKMLTYNLRMLERDGMYTRTEIADVRRHVEYRLTPLGSELSDLIMHLIGWGLQHSDEIECARAVFDSAGGQDSPAAHA